MFDAPLLRIPRYVHDNRCTSAGVSGINIFNIYSLTVSDLNFLYTHNIASYSQRCKVTEIQNTK